MKERDPLAWTFHGITADMKGKENEWTDFREVSLSITNKQTCLSTTAIADNHKLFGIRRWLSDSSSLRHFFTRETSIRAAGPIATSHTVSAIMTSS